MSGTTVVASTTAVPESTTKAGHVTQTADPRPGAQETGFIDEYTAKGSAYVQQNPKYIIGGEWRDTYQPQGLIRHVRPGKS